MIERLYPGVYLTEIPFEAKPIDGVPTAQPSAHAPAVQASEGPALDRWGRELVPDLSPLTSRYIGETEKNLDATLADAQSTDAALRYDESQSLFGDGDD